MTFPGREARAAAASDAVLCPPSDPSLGGGTAERGLRVRLASGKDLSRFNIRLDGQPLVESGLLPASTTRTVELSTTRSKAATLEVEHYNDTAARDLRVVAVEVDGSALDLAGGTVLDGKAPIERSGESDPVINYNGVYRLDLPASVADAGDPPPADPTPAPDPTPQPQPTPPTQAGACTPYVPGRPEFSYPGSFCPPQPLAKLRVYDVAPEGFQKVTGGPDEDLLLVHPEQVITGRFQLQVEGFRGIYYIGGSFDPAPAGTLKTPTGRTVEGIGSLLRLRTHPSARNPFVYLSRLDFDASRITFGDWMQVGGADDRSAQENWPVIVRYKIMADTLYGWSGYYGGTFSKFVSHSDFIKFETGGVKHSIAADIDAGSGYQLEYAMATYQTNYQPYQGADGYGQLHYWNYVGRLATDPAIGSDDGPKGFFLSRGSANVAQDEYYSIFLHGADGQGKGVYLVPPGGQGSIASNVHPGGGNFAPIDRGDRLAWPTSGYPNGRPLVTGELVNGAVRSPPQVVSPSEVGWRWRVTNRQELQAEIAGGWLR